MPHSELAKAIAPLKDASPGSPEAILYGRLKNADGHGVTAFAAIAARFTFNPDADYAYDPRGYEDLTLIDVLVRAVGLVEKVAVREPYERAAQKKMIAADKALAVIGEFVAMIADEAAAAETNDWRDFDLEPNYTPLLFQSEADELEAARKVIYTHIEHRWNLGEERLKRYHLTQVRARRGNLHYSIIAGLRDLVVSLNDCAPKARQTDIARLAGAIFGVPIAPGQVKEARKRLASQPRSFS
jgi:hypothetical protein